MNSNNTVPTHWRGGVTHNQWNKISSMHSRHFTVMWRHCDFFWDHYSDVIMPAVTSQITVVTVVLNRLFRSRKHQSTVPCHWPLWQKSTVESPHKGPVTRKICPFDGIIMLLPLCNVDVLVFIESKFLQPALEGRVIMMSHTNMSSSPHILTRVKNVRYWYCIIQHFVWLAVTALKVCNYST